MMPTAHNKLMTKEFIMHAVYYNVIEEASIPNPLQNIYETMYVHQFLPSKLNEGPNIQMNVTARFFDVTKLKVLF